MLCAVVVVVVVFFSLRYGTITHSKSFNKLVITIAICVLSVEKDRCKNCQGKKTIKERKILEVHIDKGMKDGQKITFSSEGDQEPGIEPGDIIIILDEKPHPVFRRDDMDLHMKMVC